MSENTIAFVFARGGSKGLPGKNLLPLGGTPLIGHAIACGLATPGVRKVIVSTDDEQIAAVAREHGAEVPFLRPAELATDTASEWLAWQHAIAEVQAREAFDVFLSLPATAPLRLPVDVSNCLAALDERTDLVLTVRPAERNPYFNMVVREPSGAVHRVIEPEQGLHRRQDVPEVWDVTTVAYCARPEFIINHNGVFDGRVNAVTVPKERAVDIDDAYDFAVAECLYLQRQHQHDEGAVPENAVTPTTEFVQP